MVEEILFENILYALIVRANFHESSVKFFSNVNEPLQLGYMNRPKGHKISPHKHNIVKREVALTQEVLFIKSGIIRVDFYTSNDDYLESRMLNKGDVILLANGGHGFEMIEKSEILEVKNGPYAGDFDKIRFEPIEKINLIVK